MPIQVKCQSCGARFAGRDDLAGKRVRCPKCQGVIEVPVAGADDAIQIKVDTGHTQPPPTGVGDLLDEWEQTGAPKAEAPAEYKLAAAEADKCPMCRAAMRPEAVLCVKCGYHRQKGVQMATARDGPAPAPYPAKYSSPGDNPYASPTYVDHVDHPRKFQRSMESEPAWEGGGSTGAWFSTTKSVLLDPAHTFSNIVLEGDWQQPAAYAITTYSVALFGLLAIVFVLTLAGGGGDDAAAGVAGSVCVGVCGFLVIAIGVTVGLAVRAAILHLAILATGPRRGTFTTTFRVLCYTEGALGWMYFIPFLNILFPFANLVYAIIGLKYAHDISWLRAVLSVVIPFVVMVMLFIMIAVGAAVGG